MTDSKPGVRLRDARDEDRPAIAALTLRAYGEYAETMEPGAWAGLHGAVTGALARTTPAWSGSWRSGTGRLSAA